MKDTDPVVLFQVFNEIGIIEQLTRTLLEAQMPKGLIAPHFGVLNHLIRVQDGCTPVEIARAFQVAKTTMTHTLAGLEKHGLVKMRPNPVDRRSKQIWLTQDGHDLRNQIIVDLGPELQKLAKELDAERLMGILPVLTELRVYLDENRNRSKA
jgi:DNA-binding MarR family transcriptional regulator